MRILLGGMLLGLGVGTSIADDWPQWLGPQRDGIWKETEIIEKFPADGPKITWRTKIGEGYSGPAVANGKVFVTDYLLPDGAKKSEDPFKKQKLTGSERVLCLDEKTGEIAWKHEYPCEYDISYSSGPRCSPTIDGSRVYTLGAMGDLLCLDAVKGKALWSKNFPRDYDSRVPLWGFAAHPLVDGEKIICLAGGANDRLVIAFEKMSGKELWSSQSCAGDFGYSPPMIYEFGGVRQLIIWHPHAVLGLNPETGKRLWRVDFEVKSALTAPTPRKVGEDKLFITSFYNGSLLLKVGAESAEVVWKSKARGEKPSMTTDLSSIMPTPFVDGNHIYGVCSYGQLRCIEASSGKRIWESMRATRGALTPPKVAAEPEATDGERWSNAFLVKQADRYFLFNEQGDLIIAKLSPKGYEEISRAHILDPTNRALGRKVVWSHPAFANRAVIARNDKEIVRVEMGK